MAQAYSEDLRSKILEAYEAGVGSLRELAAQFRVSWGYSKKIRMQQLRSGEKRRLAQRRHGPVGRISAEVQERVRGWVHEQPDLTEAELRERLVETGVRVCKSRVGRLLRQMGLRRKKNLSTRPSATPRPTANGARNSWQPSPRSRRRS